MIDARDPAASYGITLAGTAQILTDDVSRKSNAEIHRKYLSEAALADDRVGPVFAAWDDVTIQIAPVSYTHLDVYKRQRLTLSRLEICSWSSGLGMARRCLVERCR